MVWQSAPKPLTSLRDAMAEGMIFKALSGFYYIDDNGRQVTCRARGKFRHKKVSPLVGDRVRYSLLEDGSGSVDEILPRKNEFHRPAVANIDALVIVASGAIPKTDPFLIDRVVSIAEGKGCESIICFNKCDLDRADNLFEIYRQAGFHVLQISAETGEGIAVLSDLIAGKVCAFTGNSGVGKSSILNALEPNFGIEVGEVSHKLGRGRHTTRHVELFRMKNGAVVADTPGFSAFDVEEDEQIGRKETLAATFREFSPYINDCFFTGCSHRKEKGCSLLAALKEGKIAPSRHESYVRLYNQAEQIKDWERK